MIIKSSFMLIFNLDRLCRMKGKQWSCGAMQVVTLYLIYTGGDKIMPPYPPIRQLLRLDK